MKIVVGKVVRVGDTIPTKNMKSSHLYSGIDFKDSSGEITRVENLIIGRNLQNLLSKSDQNTEFYIYKSEPVGRSFLVSVKNKEESFVSDTDLNNMAQFYKDIRSSVNMGTFLLCLGLVGFLLLPFTLKNSSRCKKVAKDLTGKELKDYFSEHSVTLKKAAKVL